MGKVIESNEKQILRFKEEALSKDKQISLMIKGREHAEKHCGILVG